ncbi:zinc finger protein OZF-like isoform X1 [Onthophagus taurus]|uniref:zinc finger protein OZF-like isoform X1 n=2 Tax=Onthophagus taurus TaxID=166361 RepID=UPI0039BE2137
MSTKQKKQKGRSRRREVNLEKVCRCCLSDKGTLKDVIDTKLPPMLQFCTSIDMLGDDQLPKQICIECLRLITKFYIFKRKALKCNMFLQNLVKKRSKEKYFSDILDEAVSVADISVQDRFVGYENEDGSVITIDLKKLKSKTLASDSIEEIYTTISLVEPPPLIPLGNASKGKTNEIKITSTRKDEDIKPPPPLVPLKKLNLSDKPVENQTVTIKTEDDIESICLTCKQSFDSNTNLIEHEKQCHKKHKLQCNICEKQFADRKALIIHLKAHVRIKSGNMLSCHFCGQKYANQSTLQLHIRRHTGERPFKCEVCHKGFVRYAGLKEHMRTHSKMKPYECDVCKKSFTFKSNLTRHRFLHSSRLPFSCNYCGRTFGQNDNLQTHIRSNHTFERPFLCTECGTGFVSATGLKRHMYVHTGTKKHFCQNCNKSYSNLVDLKVHERVHNSAVEIPKPFACHKCNRSFFLQCRLLKHMRVHEKPFSCDECERSFFKPENLQKHKIRKHEIAVNRVLMKSGVNVEVNENK